MCFAAQQQALRAIEQKRYQLQHRSRHVLEQNNHKISRLSICKQVQARWPNQEELLNMVQTLREKSNREEQKRDAIAIKIKEEEKQYQWITKLKDKARAEYQQYENLRHQTKKEWKQYKATRNALIAECDQLKVTKDQIMRAINQKGNIVAENRSLAEALKQLESLCIKLQEEKKELEDQQLRSLIDSDEVIEKLDAEIQTLKKEVASKDEKLKQKNDIIRNSSSFLQDRVRELRQEIEAKDQQIRSLKLMIQISAQKAQIKQTDPQKAESIQEVLQDKSVASKINESAYLKKPDIYQSQTHMSQLKSALHDLQSRLAKLSTINRALSQQNKVLMKANINLNDQFSKLCEQLLSYDEQSSLRKDSEMIDNATSSENEWKFVGWNSSLDRAAEQHAQNKAKQNELNHMDRTSLSSFLRRQMTGSVQSQP